MKLSRNDYKSMLGVIWNALEGYRETCIPEGRKEYDLEWDDITTVMAWIAEELGEEAA